MRIYSLVFAFDAAEQNVLLIKKRHGPANLIGKWNGLGGIVESGETPYMAAVREFEEECGLELNQQSNVVRHFATFSSQLYAVHCFRATADLSQARTTTHEEVRVWPLSALPQRLDPTARWLLQLARDSAVSGPVSVRMLR